MLYTLTFLPKAMFIYCYLHNGPFSRCYKHAGTYRYIIHNCHWGRLNELLISDLENFTYNA